MTLALPPETTDPGVIVRQVADAFATVDQDRVPGTTLLSVAIEVPVHSPSAWFDAADRVGAPAAIWLDAAGPIVAMGAASTIDLIGPRRFEHAQRRWHELVGSARTSGPAAASPTAGPLLLGGATFEPRRSHDGRWAGFEDGRLDVPELVVRTAGRTSILTAIIAVDEQKTIDGPAKALCDRLDRWLRAVDEGSRPDAGSDDQRVDPHWTRPATLSVVDATPDRATWSAMVARVAGAVGRGRLDKVVLARRLDVSADTALDVATILERLAGPSDPGLAPRTRFAFRRHGRTFLGATPEVLVAGDGQHIRTVALAGTTARGQDAVEDQASADALLASEKDREEHAVVVDMLRSTLTGTVDDLVIGSTPHIVTLPSVHHLATDVTGTLPSGVGLLDLVQSLHPTPAVGGWPRDAALDLIAEQEGIDRGWYAGPVGWLDAAGRGCFMVAIRSCVIDDRRASLFAGCGIVGDSEPDREWQESTIKLEATLQALGEHPGWPGERPT